MAAKNSGTKNGSKPKSQNVTKKRPAAKKNTGSKHPASKTASKAVSKSSARTTQKRQYKKTAPKKKQPSQINYAYIDAESYIKRRRFIKGIMLIGASVIFTLLFFLPGEKVWLALHQGYWGLFGYLGFTVPLINIYCAVQLMQEKSTYRFPLKVFFFCSTVILFASTSYAFHSSGMKMDDYSTELINAFRNAAQGEGTGFIGGLLGIPFAKALGSLAGGLVLLVLFLFCGFISFEALFMNIIEKLKEPVNEKISDHKEIRKRIREEENKIKSEQKKKMREEYVDKKVKQHMDAKKKKQQDKSEQEKSQYKRVNRTPFYQPDNDDEENYDNYGDKYTVNYKPKKEEPSKVKEQPKPFDEPVNNIPVPPKTSKNNKHDKLPNMDYISGETEILADNIDISALLKKGDKSMYIPDNEPQYQEQDSFQLVDDVYSSTSKKQNTKRRQKSPKPENTSKPLNSRQMTSNIKGNKNDVNYDIIEGTYLKPPFTLLEPQPEEQEDDIAYELNTSAATLVDTLRSFGVQTTIINISRGPSVTRYELQPASGVKISKITNLADDIAMNLAATGVRIEAPIPGKNAVGIEVPNRNISIVKMRELIESKEFQNAKSKLTVALGMDITGHITLADLARMPHLLIAGSTGSGKSVCINSMLVSLLYKANPDEVKLILIDPKVVELGVYNGIPHLLVPVVTDPRKAAGALNWAVNEMLERYKTFAEYNVRDMYGYNRLVDKTNAEYDELETEPEDDERSFEEDAMLAQAQNEIGLNSEINYEPPQRLKMMCQIVIVIDELADLMMAAPKEVEESICRLAQMARAAGMHLVIATQRPSVDVITGLIKANVPSRIAFAVKSQIDSRTILDIGGAEKLLGRGDMLYSPIGTTKPVRVQGCFVDDYEIENIINFIKKNKAVEYDDSIINEIENNSIPDNTQSGADTDSNIDPVMEQAIKCVVEAGQASTSLLQRRLRLGYARAGRLIDEMEQMGIVGPHEGSKPRQVLMTYQQWLERSMSSE